MRRFKKIIFTLVAIALVIHLILWITGNTYLYKVARYTFADIDDNKIFEERMIQKSNQPQPWPLSTHYNKNRPSPSLIKNLEELETVAFLIIKNDSIYYEQYWDQYNDHSLSNSFSVAKSFVSTLIGIAIDEGKIKSIDQSVGDFLPDFKEGTKSTITIKHLLMMSSGLNWDESYMNPFSFTTEAYYGSDLKKLISKLKSIEKPGIKFTYKSGDTQILGLVLEKATGKNLSDYLSEKIWNPLGAEHNAEWSTDHKDGTEKAYCCLFSNARDFARLGKLYLHKGDWNGKQILSEPYIQQATTPTSLIDETKTPVTYYGYQWWLIPTYKKEPIFYARGILGQYIIVIPEKNTVVVRLGKKRAESKDNHPGEVWMMIDEIYQNF